MKIDFSREQLVVLDKALQQLPYYVAAPLINHINALLQNEFDKGVDERGTPSGHAVPDDPYRGE